MSRVKEDNLCLMLVFGSYCFLSHHHRVKVMFVHVVCDYYLKDFSFIKKGI